VATHPSRPFVPSEAFEIALALHRQGQVREAEAIYRTVLKATPDHSDSLHHLGVVKAQQGHLDEAQSGSSNGACRRSSGWATMTGSAALALSGIASFL
jgi:hypothetical protein